AEAKVSKQTVYRYYGSKHQLFLDVLGQTAEQLRADVLQLVPATPLALDQLEATLLTVAEHILDRILDPTYLDLVRVVIAEAREFPELPRDFRATVVERGAAALTELLRSESIAAVVETSRVEPALRLFVGPLLSYLLESLMGDPATVRRRASAQ